MDCSLPGSSVHWILQASILEWVAMPSSKYTGVGCHALLHGDLPDTGIKHISLMSPALAAGFFTTSTTLEARTTTTSLKKTVLRMSGLGQVVISYHCWGVAKQILQNKQKGENIRFTSSKGKQNISSMDTRNRGKRGSYLLHVCFLNKVWASFAFFGLVWFCFCFGCEKMGDLVKKKGMEHAKSWSSSNNSQVETEVTGASERWGKKPTMARISHKARTKDPPWFHSEKKKLGFSLNSSRWKITRMSLRPRRYCEKYKQITDLTSNWRNLSSTLGVHISYSPQGSKAWIKVEEAKIAMSGSEVWWCRMTFSCPWLQFRFPKLLSPPSASPLDSWFGYLTAQHLLHACSVTSVASDSSWPTGLQLLLAY